MFDWAKSLWPLNRSLTGEGNRETLDFIKNRVAELKTKEIPTGNQVFDWTVPPEWRINEAWIETPDGQRICNFKDNNLNVVGYSISVDTELDLEQLLPHIHSLPSQPEAIPYVTSYYEKNWGFCAPHELKESLRPGKYRAYIDAEHFVGGLSLGEIVLKGSDSTEILLSTYICHPSMANNELSGIVLALKLAQWIREIPNRKHTYRIIFAPETIGAISYISDNLVALKEKTIAGYVLTCVGDDRDYSFLPSRNGHSFADVAGIAALKSIDPNFKRYRWQDRESDERQYCAPGVDLPVASIMRSKYGTYPEYHTSQDMLGTVVTPEGLAGGFLAYMRVIQILELDCKPTVTTLCEPQLGKRGLYPNLGIKGTYEQVRIINELIGSSDGETSLLTMSENLGVSFREMYIKFLELARVNILAVQ